MLLLTGAALAERPRVIWRRIRGARPRLVWGPSSIFNIVYWSQAMRDRGWDSVTCVDVPPPQAKAGDFDVTGNELAASSRLPRALHPYAQFLWALRHGDVFVTNFDAGHLRWTPLSWREFLFLKLAGKKTVVWPYGGDIAVVGHLGKWEPAWIEDYPHLPEHAEELERRITHAAKWADVLIRTKQVAFTPPSQVWWGNALAIDVDSWQGTAPPSDRDGRNGPVAIVHAPNHRALKRTDALEAAVEKLRGEGLEIDLQILEGRSNEEVRDAVKRSDIVADQFSGAGYALFAIEGMAAGRPVVSSLSGVPDFRPRLLELGCPVVDTDADADPQALVDELRKLVADPARRRRLGAAGEDFVRRCHSYAAAAQQWEAIIDFAWRGARLPDQLRPRFASPGPESGVRPEADGAGAASHATRAR